MALPSVKSLADCADFNGTVLPYIHQLYDLPQAVVQNIADLQGLKQLYVSTNPFISALALSLLLAPVFLVVSEVNKNYSQVDRCWGILPTLYNGHFVAYAHLVGLPTSRLDLLLVFSVLWSIRLTFNYWRKGGYNIGSEDYRWEIVRNCVHPVLFFIFNVLFISLAQSLLLFSLVMPSYLLLLASSITGDTIHLLDIGISQGLVVFVSLAAMADQQQWNYQSAKIVFKKSSTVSADHSKEDLDRGFLTQGLWAYSRHPNFAAEQLGWLTLYVWSCVTTQTYFNWTGIGILLYHFLFQASTWLTELISRRKYPDYVEYQRKVGKFLPIPGLSWSSKSASNDRKKIQ